MPSLSGGVYGVQELSVEQSDWLISETAKNNLAIQDMSAIHWMADFWPRMGFLVVGIVIGGLAAAAIAMGGWVIPVFWIGLGLGFALCIAIAYVKRTWRKTLKFGMHKFRMKFRKTKPQS